VFFCRCHSTAPFADELRVSDEWLDLFDIKVTRATGHCTHLVVVPDKGIGFGHVYILPLLCRFINRVGKSPDASIVPARNSQSQDDYRKDRVSADDFFECLAVLRGHRGVRYIEIDIRQRRETAARLLESSFMACAERFGCRGVNEWGVGHYLFSRRDG